MNLVERNDRIAASYKGNMLEHSLESTKARRSVRHAGPPTTAGNRVARNATQSHVSQQVPDLLIFQVAYKDGWLSISGFFDSHATPPSPSPSPFADGILSQVILKRKKKKKQRKKEKEKGKTRGWVSSQEEHQTTSSNKRLGHHRHRKTLMAMPPCLPQELSDAFP